MGKLKAANWVEDERELATDWAPEIRLPYTNMIQYKSIVDWLYDNIPDTEENVLWTWRYYPVLRFKDSKHHTWFMLAWA